MTAQHLIASDKQAERMAALVSDRKYVKMRYDNSPWDSGPRYRRELDEIDAEIAALQKEEQVS